jgi:membrane protease YdiL (CAAX protease family)
VRILRILALVLAALILVPSAAHLFELPGKVGLDRDSYFIVQGIYAGWSLFAVPIFAGPLCKWRAGPRKRRKDPVAAGWALAAAVLIVVSLAVFFTWTRLIRPPRTGRRSPRTGRPSAEIGSTRTLRTP